jgi:lambda repressor-like predicted transcriptional regulator
MEDPFATIRQLAHKREQAQHEWQQEIRALHAAGFSLRAIANVAGVSHDTVWKKVR